MIAGDSGTVRAGLATSCMPLISVNRCTGIGVAWKSIATAGSACEEGACVCVMRRARACVCVCERERVGGEYES